MDLTEIFMPSIIGLIKVINVQMAAIPIAPAPIKRTFDFQTAMANLAVAPPSGASMLVKYGTKPAHAMRTPTRIAIPEAIPIR